MQTMHTQIDHRPLTCLNDLILNLLANFRYDLLNTCGVDTTILYQLVKRQTGDLTADRIKA